MDLYLPAWVLNFNKRMGKHFQPYTYNGKIKILLILYCKTMSLNFKRSYFDGWDEGERKGLNTTLSSRLMEWCQFGDFLEENPILYKTFCYPSAVCQKIIYHTYLVKFFISSQRKNCICNFHEVFVLEREVRICLKKLLLHFYEESCS